MYVRYTGSQDCAEVDFNSEQIYAIAWGLITLWYAMIIQENSLPGGLKERHLGGKWRLFYEDWNEGKKKPQMSSGNNI